MQNHPPTTIGRRVSIIGTTGVGKSTLAAQLCQKLGANRIEIDGLFWLPEWQERPDEEMWILLEEKTQAKCWVMDGNYSRFREVTWARVETVIILDLPYWLNFWQLFYRTVHRSITKKPLWGTSNTSSLWKQFTSQDSILNWFFKTYHRRRKSYPQLLENPDYKHIQFVQLNSRKAVRDWLEVVEMEERK